MRPTVTTPTTPRAPPLPRPRRRRGPTTPLGMMASSGGMIGKLDRTTRRRAICLDGIPCSSSCSTSISRPTWHRERPRGGRTIAYRGGASSSGRRTMTTTTTSSPSSSKTATTTTWTKRRRMIASLPSHSRSAPPSAMPRLRRRLPLLRRPSLRVDEVGARRAHDDWECDDRRGGGIRPPRRLRRRRRRMCRGLELSTTTTRRTNFFT